MTQFMLNDGASVTITVEKDSKILIAALDGSSGADLRVTADQADTLGSAILAASRKARRDAIRK